MGNRTTLGTTAILRASRPVYKVSPSTKELTFCSCTPFQSMIRCAKGNRDAGDHHDGSGLVSTSPSSAAQADHIFSMLQYDVLTIGNHELYRYSVAREIHDHRDQWSVQLGICRITS